MSKQTHSHPILSHQLPPTKSPPRPVLYPSPDDLVTIVLPPDRPKSCCGHGDPNRRGAFPRG